MFELPYERYAGNVPMPVAVYRPGNVFGGGMIGAHSLGIAHYSLLAVMEQERGQLVAEEKAIVKAIEGSGGARTDAQRDRLAAIDVRLEGADGNPGLLADISAEQRRLERERTSPAVTERAAELALETMVSAPDAPTPFASLGEFLQGVQRSTVAVARGGRADEGVMAVQDFYRSQAAAAGANETAGADGGYLVQKDISNELLDAVFATGQLSQRARRIPVGANANGIKINVVDETSRATGSRWGGVQVYWAAEAAAATASRPKFKPLEMTLQKLIGLFYATDELLGDASALDAVATRAFTDEFGFMVDDAMIRGSGAGKPLGVLNAPALVSVAKETAQAADTLISENVEKMYARMAPRSLSKATWFINQELWPSIFQLAHVIGTGGVPMYIPAGGLSNAPFGTLLGRPIDVLEQSSAIGDVGDILFGDFDQYALIDKGGIKSDSSIHVQFLTDEMTFRWTLRVNGQPTWTSARTPFKGSASISPFVTLDAR
jgi:HK97 family phage major capsid protein